jgi:hypothetical protein
MELTPAGEVIGRWQWQLPSGYSTQNDLFMRVAMTADNRVYAQVVHPRATPDDAIRRDVFKLDREAGMWNRVDNSSLVSVYGEYGEWVWLFGSDGDTLLYKVPMDEVVWVRPSAQ